MALKQIDANRDISVKEDLEARTELGRECMRQFRMALVTKRTTRIGDQSLETVLRECKEARDNASFPKEREALAKYPEWANMPISLVAFKVGLLVAIIRESLVDVAKAPFIVDPTPEPEIPQQEKEELAQQVLNDLMAESGAIIQAQHAYIAQAVQAGLDPNQATQQPDFPRIDPKALEERLTQEKVKLNQKIRTHASEQAALLQRELYDRTIEGGYKRAVIEFADDFATYPFGCMHAPFPIVKKESVWKGNKFVEEKKVVWAFERVSPFDLFWTEDSTNTQDGTAVFIRKYVSYDYLFDCRQMAIDDPEAGYQLDAIDDIIELAEDGRIPRMWSEFTPGNPERLTNLLTWNRGSNVEIIIRYGRFLGSELIEMGYEDLENHKLYETKVILCGGQVIYCALNNNPSPYVRPVFTASFESRNGSIAGVGLGQRLLPLHLAYRTLMRLMMYNLGLSSEPITELEIARLIDYVPEEWVKEPVVQPGMVFPTDGDRGGNGSRAVKFTQIPNTTGQILQTAEYIFSQAHVLSNIPAALHGQPVGSGANRTVRGLLTLQGNTLKPIQSALINLDLGVIEPMVTLLYMLLVMYDDDFTYTGDCKIIAKGSASMIEREMSKQTAMENLQILGQLGTQVNPEILNRAVEELLRTADIVQPGEEVFNSTPATPPVVEGQEEQSPAQPLPPMEPLPAG